MLVWGDFACPCLDFFFSFCLCLGVFLPNSSSGQHQLIFPSKYLKKSKPHCNCHTKSSICSCLGSAVGTEARAVFTVADAAAPVTTAAQKRCRREKVPPKSLSKFECRVRNHAELTVMDRRCVWEQKLNKSRLEMCCRLRHGLIKYERYSGVEGWAQRLDGLAFSTAVARVKSTQTLPIELFVETCG